MRIFFQVALIFPFILSLCLPAGAQTEATVVWQVTKFDITANIQQPERTLNGTATINATNVGTAPGSTFTVRLNSKAKVTGAAVGGATSTFRSTAEPRSELQRVITSLPGAVPPNGNINVTINYAFPVEANTGLAAISPIASQFLPLSFWYPMPNTPFTIRGVDTAPFRIAVNIPNVVSSGVEKPGSGSVTSFEQAIHGQPFFLQGDWERVEGTGDAQGIIAYVSKGASQDERKRAEAINAYAAAARTYFVSLFGNAPNTPVRIVGARRGVGFSDTGTVLVDAEVFKVAKIDAATALHIAETVARLWIAGQAPVRGEGSGALRDGLVRFLANSFIEKQFGREAAESEMLRQRLAFIAVSQRDGPIARANQLDSTYFGSVPNRGAMVWRLVDRKLGHDAFVDILRNVLQNANSDRMGLTLSSFRSALVNRGGDSLKALLDQQLDQVTDLDLMIGLPQQRGAEWVSALRNLGAIDVSVPVVATTDSGEKIIVDVVIQAKNFGEAVFKTTSRVVRAEIDPDKLYPQLDYSNDSAPKSSDITEGLSEASRQLSAQEFVKAETTARALFSAFPRLQEARILLARALLGQNKIDEADRLFRTALDDALPTSATLAWANIGLGEISLKRGQAAEAAKRFNDAVTASRETPSSLAARAGRIRAETAANNAPAIDESARTFIAQLSQSIVNGKKAELDSRVVPGELVRFVNGIVGSQPELWEIRVLRTELLDANLLAADVGVRAKQLGNEAAGTAVLLLSRVSGGWKLSGIELFEVR